MAKEVISMSDEKHMYWAWEAEFEQKSLLVLAVLLGVDVSLLSVNLKCWLSSMQNLIKSKVSVVVLCVVQYC